MKKNNDSDFLKQTYSLPEIDPTFSILLMGEWGTGKTFTLGTSPLPLLLYSFDPKGTVVLNSVYPKLISRKMIQVIPFWNERAGKPTEYLKWEKLWEKHIETGYLDQFGTVAVDSFTTWIEAAGNEWLKRKNLTRKSGIPIDQLAIGDYPGLYDLTRTMIKRTSSCNCNFILTAHLEPEVIEVTEQVRYVLATYKGLKIIVPPLFTEKWVTTKKPKADKTEYYILTNNEGLYSASTQIGAKTFKRRETPNIKALLKKAGYSAEDKPAFWEEEGGEEER